VHQPEHRRRIVEYIRSNARPPDKFSHQARLYRLARQLAGDKSFDDDVLFAAAWMHDLGVFIGHRPESPDELEKWDHVAYALNRVPAILRELGFPEEKIPRVLEVIRAHLPSAKPQSFESVLLRDADLLEQLGAIAILRTVSKVGRDTRFVRFSDALRVLKENLQNLPPALQLESARRLAEPRVKILKEFLDAAEAETGSIEW
jgi:uncharacterized protein